MRIYVDESGNFGWNPQGLSIQTAVIVEDSNETRSHCLKRIAEWERSVPRAQRQNGEVKAALLTDEDLLDFAKHVIVGQHIVVTSSGFDSNITTRRVFEAFRASQNAWIAPEFVRHAARDDRQATQFVKEFAHWIVRLSDPQWAWLVTLESVFAGSLQRAILYHLEEDGTDLATVRFSTDRSWLRKERHLRFWRNLLNSRMNGQSTLKPLLWPSDWAPEHPFRKTYDTGRGYDFRKLWQMTEFVDSRADPGIRFADIVAHTIRRFFREGKAKTAFDLIEKHCARGEMLTIVAPEPDSKLASILGFDAK